MPSWLIFAILQPATLTVVNFTDKYILSKEIRDYKGFVIFMTIVSFVVGTLLWIVTGFPILNLKDTLLVLSVGILLLSGSLSYYKVMSEHDASKVIFMFQAQPVFVLILSVIFLNESLSAKGGVEKIPSHAIFRSGLSGSIPLIDVV
jgi:drug/metabolite transporter (DMT)-like permease